MLPPQDHAILASSPFGETEGKALGHYLSVILRGVADGTLDHLTGVAYLQQLVVMAVRGDLEDIRRLLEADVGEEAGTTG